MQEQIGVRIGRDYPQLVDRAVARERTLNAYNQAKSTSRNQKL